jgi:hypothetical protein
MPYFEVAAGMVRGREHDRSGDASKRHALGRPQGKTLGLGQGHKFIGERLGSVVLTAPDIETWRPGQGKREAPGVLQLSSTTQRLLYQDTSLIRQAQ